MTTGQDIEVPDWLADRLLTWQDSFSWQTRAEHFDVVETWARPRSGSAFYRLQGQPDGPEAVVKVVSGWRDDDPRTAFAAMDDLERIIESTGVEGARGIKPLAWSDDPCALVTEYAESLDLVSILRRPEHPAWGNGNLDRWIEIAGAVLAAYHQSSPSGWELDCDEAETEIRGLGRKAGVSIGTIDRMLDALDPGAIARRRYGDYGPGNLQGAADGALYFLDPPVVSHTSTIHRDIANFLFETRRQLAGRGYTSSEPVRGRFADLRLRFILGYFGDDPTTALGPADEALLALFDVKRAVALARKRFPSRLSDAAWFARLAVRRRRDLTRAVSSL